MKQSIQEFENQLILGLQPVTVRNFGGTIFAAMTAATAYTVLCAALLGSGFNFNSVWANTSFLAGFVCLIIAMMILVAAAISSGFPGRAKPTGTVMVLSVLLFALANGLYIYSGTFDGATHNHKIQPGLSEIVICGGMSFLLAVVPSLAVVFSLGRLAPLNKTTSALLAAGFAASSGSLIMMIHCPLNEASHRLFGHFLSFAVIVPVLFGIIFIASKLLQKQNT